jgi:regulator of protease activity HflC (stomatin/prohibitin superfamily)
MSSYDNNETNQSYNIFKLAKTPLIVTGIFFLLQVIIVPLFLLEVPVGYGAVTAFGGSVDETVYLSGPHFVAPWKKALNWKLQTVVRPRDTTPTDSNNQPITAKVLPQVWIEPSAIPTLARNYGDYESMMKSVVEPQINQATRGKTSQRDPEHLIWERHEVVVGIQEALQTGISDALKVKGVSTKAVHVGLVSIPQFGFSKAVRDTLENKAESHVRTLTAKALAKIAEIEADRKAQLVEIAADGESQAKEILASADAYKADKIGKANAAAPIVAKYESIMKWLDAGGHASRIQLSGNSQVILPPLQGTTTAPATQQ